MTEQAYVLPKCPKGGDVNCQFHHWSEWGPLKMCLIEEGEAPEGSTCPEGLLEVSS